MKKRVIKKQKLDTKIKHSKDGIIGLIKVNKGLHNITVDFEKNFLKSFPTEKDAHFFSHTYSYRAGGFLSRLDFYINLYEFLDIRYSDQDHLKHYLFRITDSDLNRTKEKFKENFERLKKFLIRTDKEISRKLANIGDIECYRLNEAMKCLYKCNLAAVLMAVSAVEHRLHRLLERTNRRIYKAEFEKKTLGGIIAIFKKDAYMATRYKRFRNILPEKHKPLMEILNIYRIFSAHPNEERISNQTAKAILAFSFLLLVDTDLKI